MPQAANPGTQTSAGSLSDETLAELDNDPSKVKNLSRADKYALADRIMNQSEDDDAPAPAPSEAPVKDAPAEEVPATAAPEEEKKPESPSEEATDEKPFRKDRRYWKEKAIKEAEEKNAIKQRFDAQKRHLEALQKTEEEVKAVKADKPLDVYDDSQMKSFTDEFAQMKKELAAYRELQKSTAKSEFEETQKTLLKREEDSVFTAINRLQAEFEDLKTEMPFERANAEYATWLDKLVSLSGFKEAHPTTPLAELRGMAKELFNEDEDFRKTAIAKRAKPPKELEKIETILTIHEKKGRDGGGYRANYLDMLAETGVLPDVFAKRERDAALKASNATVDAMSRGNKGVNTLSPNEGSSNFSTASAPEKMQAYLKGMTQRVAKGHRMTTDERAQVMTYVQLLSTGDQ